MRNWAFLILLVLLGCGEKESPNEVVPDDAIEVFVLENQSTFRGEVSFFLDNRDQYSTFECFVNDEKKDFNEFFTLDQAGARYPDDINLPVVFQANTSREQWGNFYGELSIAENSADIKHGYGSTMLSPREINSSIVVSFDGQEKSIEVEIVAPVYTEISGTISSNGIFQEDEFYHITGDLTIASSVVLQIPAGCVFKIDEGVNINNLGEIEFNGTASKPIVVACSSPDSYWGGIVSDEGTSVKATHSIFIQGGFNDSESYQYGHAKRQAIFYHRDSDLILNHVNAIDNAGQVFFLRKQSYLNVDNSSFQRAISAGEVVNSTITISNSTFTDFPEYSPEYEDKDNDCIYINNSNATISSCSFMYSKDDGIDTGGSGGGTVTIDGCHFEGMFHEAIAMSSADAVNKTHLISNSTFINNGQGIELGYSSINHQVTVDDCTFNKNMVGVRYGDNYASDVDGFMQLSNCNFSNNSYQDIWNFVRKEWSAIDENLVY